MVTKKAHHAREGASNACNSCLAHAGIEESNKHLWAVILIILAGTLGFISWQQTQLAEARAYTDIKVLPIIEIRDTVIELEINLKSYMMHQGYDYQEIKRKG